MTRTRQNKALRAYEDRPFNLKSKVHRDYLNVQKNQGVAERDASAQEARENERALCSQLMLVATVFLTLSMLAVGNGDLFKDMTYDQRWLTLLAVGALGSSIGTGIRYYFVLVKFYNDWAYAKQDIALIYGEVKSKTPLEARNKAYAATKHLDMRPNKKWLQIQIAMLAVACSAYVLLLIAVLFSFHDITRHLPLRLQ
ncbi:MAG TPA: hypothetical protein VFT53_04125 [Candidatus Saccharimonadales bacterium]|nr:hypothetical protein [Candidatus Saccharimonadales bacterium]